MTDGMYLPKIYKKDGGDAMVVASGGSITVEEGGSLTVGGVEITSSTLAVNDLTASAAELNILDGATISTEELNKLEGAGATVASGTPVTFQADLANDANGAAIAAAVNGLRDVLVAFKAMQAGA